MPLMVDMCELRTDSGGEGRRRGGAGLRREVRLLDDEASYSVLSDRGVIPPYGMLGGNAGRQYHLSVRREGEEKDFDTPGKVTGHPLQRDDVVIIRSSGGGGYGDPLDRDPEAVRADVEFGVVSVERARDGYGVVLCADESVDDNATAALRTSLRSQRFYLNAAFKADFQPYVGLKGHRRVLRLSTSDAARLAVKDDDLVELLGKNPAPLRAWVTIDRSAGSGTFPIEEFGCKVLGIKDGDRVEIRRLWMPHIPKGMAK
jgi:N-methylhydantoinase B